MMRKKSSTNRLFMTAWIGLFLLSSFHFLGCSKVPTTETTTEKTNTDGGNLEKNQNENPPTGCKNDTECPAGKSCQSGECKEVVDKNVARVEIVSGPSVLRESETGTLLAVAFNKSDARLSSATFTWKSSDDTLVAVDATGKVTGGSKDGVAEIVAESEGIKSAAFKIQNFAKISADKMRVLVLDDAGKPVSGAKVLVKDKEATTDANGSVTVDVKAPADVHVFHADYTYFSAFDVNSSDLFVQVTKNTDKTKAGGVQGNFDFKEVLKVVGENDNDGQARNVGFGIAGFSLPGSITDLDFTVLLGENIKQKVLNLAEVALPSALMISLSGDPNAKYRVLGRPGKRLLWGLGGKFSLNRLLTLIGSDAINDPSKINPAEIISKVGPILNELFFGMVGKDIDVQEIARIVDTNDINGNSSKTDLIPDFAKFPTQDLLLNLPLNKTIKVTLNNPPKNSVGAKMYVIGLAGVFVPGRGLIPVGIAIGDDASTELSVKHPTLTGELASGKFVVGAVYVTLPLGATPPPLHVAAGFKTSDTPPTSVTFDKYVGFGKSGSYKVDTRVLSDAKATNASFHQLEITTVDGKRWVVYYKDQTTLTLPQGPAGMEDRLAKDKVLSVSIRPILLEGSLTLDSLLEFNSTNLDSVNYKISSFSNIYAYQKPAP